MQCTKEAKAAATIAETKLSGKLANETGQTTLAAGISVTTGMTEENGKTGKKRKGKGRKGKGKRQRKNWNWNYIGGKGEGGKTGSTATKVQLPELMLKVTLS